MLGPGAIICPSLRAMVHLLPAMGHTTDTLDAGEIRFYRGSRGVLLIGRLSGCNLYPSAVWMSGEADFLVVIGLGE